MKAGFLFVNSFVTLDARSKAGMTKGIGLCL